MKYFHPVVISGWLPMGGIVDNSKERLLTNQELSSKLNRDEMNQVKDLVDSVNNSQSESELINLACLIEGSIRNLGLHACGIIITPDDITNYIPVCKSSDSNLLIVRINAFHILYPSLYR